MDGGCLVTRLIIAGEGCGFQCGLLAELEGCDCAGKAVVRPAVRLLVF